MDEGKSDKFNSKADGKSAIRSIIDRHKNSLPSDEEFFEEVSNDAKEANTRRNYDCPKTGAHKSNHI